MGSISLRFWSLKGLEKTGIIWRSKLLFAKVFNYFVSLMVIRLFRFSNSSWNRFYNLYFYKKYFHPVCKIIYSSHNFDIFSHSIFFVHDIYFETTLPFFLNFPEVCFCILFQKINFETMSISLLYVCLFFYFIIFFSNCITFFFHFILLFFF